MDEELRRGAGDAENDAGTDIGIAMGIGIKVRAEACKTCIYREESPLDLAALEEEVRDRYGGFDGWRICHYENDVCCRGFWNRHKHEFTLGQLAQRLGQVQIVRGNPAGDPGREAAGAQERSGRRAHRGAPGRSINGTEASTGGRPRSTGR